MKNVKLYVWNYGVHSKPIADFKNNFHEAIQCVNAMNNSLITHYGKLPDRVFYYLTYTAKYGDMITLGHFDNENSTEQFRIVKQYINTKKELQS